jgi:hypothetical protein
MTTTDAATEGVTVLDLDGRAQPLEALWRSRPALVVFLRHFG